jgi:hypothetical protein
MNLKVNVYGLDGGEARELMELISNLPEVDDVETRYTTHDHAHQVIPEIQASAAIPIAKFLVKLAGTAIATNMAKDGYETVKAKLKVRLEKFQSEKNEGREPRLRIHFTVMEEGQSIARFVRKDKDES